MAREKNFENQIKKYLEEKGAWFVKYFANSMTKAGIPDILVCLKGKFIAIEVKAETGRPSELQEYHLKQINKAGGFGILLYPSGFDEFKKSIDYFSQHGGVFKPNCNGYLKLKRGWYE